MSAPAQGNEARRLAVGTLAIQGATVVSIIAFLAVATVLGRRLTLAEFGVYGLTLSFALYAQFIQGSVEGAAVKSIAEATDAEGRSRAFTTTASVYAVLGLAAGVIVAVVGLILLGIFDIPHDLAVEGKRGVVGLAVLIAIGWPLRTFHDALHGLQHFVAVSIADTLAYIAFAALVITLAVTGAPLWLVIAAGGSMTVLSGLGSALIAGILHTHLRFRRRLLERHYLRGYMRFAGYVLATAASDLVIYQLDRVMLAIFKSASTIGLYEATVRPQTLVRQLHGTLVATVLPASSKYRAEGDEARERELALRGTRYVLAITVPITVFVMVMAGPLLEAWLGRRYLPAQGALTIFVAYWLFGSNTGVLGSMMWAHARGRALAIQAWATALMNLALALILTPLIGLEGVVASTTIAYAAIFPFFIRLVTRTLGLPLSELWRHAWRPVYPLAAVLALALGILRLALPDANSAVMLTAGVVLLCGYWVAFYAVSLDDSERRLFRQLLSRSRNAPPEPA